MQKLIVLLAVGTLSAQTAGVITITRQIDVTAGNLKCMATIMPKQGVVPFMMSMVCEAYDDKRAVWVKVASKVVNGIAFDITDTIKDSTRYNLDEILWDITQTRWMVTANGTKQAGDFVIQ